MRITVGERTNEDPLLKSNTAKADSQLFSVNSFLSLFFPLLKCGGNHAHLCYTECLESFL